MANKYKRINHEPQKKVKDDSSLRTILVLVGIALIAIVIGVMYNSNKGQQPQQTNNTGNQATQQKPDLTQFQTALDQAQKAAQAKPKDYTSLVNLGNAYYDLADAYYSNGNDTDSTTNYAKAVDPYQQALAQKFDISVQTDLATAAFYGGKVDIAEAAFKIAVEKQPDFLTARFNYGVFLNEVKKDKEGAKKQIEYVANQTKDTTAANKAKEFLKTLQ